MLEKGQRSTVKSYGLSVNMLRRDEPSLGAARPKLVNAKHGVNNPIADAGIGQALVGKVGEILLVVWEVLQVPLIEVVYFAKLQVHGREGRYLVVNPVQAHHLVQFINLKHRSPPPLLE